MTLWSNKTIKTTHVGIISLVISKLRRCWGPRPPQKFRKSHWCVPFTATFSKRRKIGALWSERCDAEHTQVPGQLCLKMFTLVSCCQCYLCTKMHTHTHLYRSISCQRLMNMHRYMHPYSHICQQNVGRSSQAYFLERNSAMDDSIGGS